jgi:hypothetical protein
MPVINDNNNTYLNSITIPDTITYGDVFDIVVSTSDQLTNILITTNDTSIFSINSSNNQITVIGVIPIIQTNLTITCTQDSESITTNLLTITKKNLVVNVDSKTMVYGSYAPLLSSSYNSFVNNDTSSSLSGELSYFFSISHNVFSINLVNLSLSN